MKEKRKRQQTTGPGGSGLLRQIVKMRHYYLLLLPFLAFLIVFKYVPMYGLTLAFKDFKIRAGILGSPWAGFKYFRQLFYANSFLNVLGNTLIISLQKLIFCFPAPIALAIFINEIRNARVRKTFQVISYLPHFLSWVIAASLITDLLSLNGPLNAVVQLCGGEPVYFLANVKAFRPVLILTDIWKGCGWSSIVYLAAIAGVDQDLYEAAKIDGAGRWKQIWHVTLPGIRATILTLFILQIGSIMSAGFDQVFNLYSPAVYSVGDILDTYTYRQGIEQANYSYATAAGLFQNAVGFVLVIISNFVTRRLSDGEEGLW